LESEKRREYRLFLTFDWQEYIIGHKIVVSGFKA